MFCQYIQLWMHVVYLRLICGTLLHRVVELVAALRGREGVVAGGVGVPLLLDRRQRIREAQEPACTVGETVILLPPPLHLVGVSIVIQRGCRQHWRDCYFADALSLHPY